MMSLRIAHHASWPSTDTQLVTMPPRRSSELPLNMQRLPAACKLPACHSGLLSAAPLIRRLATAFPDAAIFSAQAAQRRLIDYTSSLVGQQRSCHRPEQHRPQERKSVRPGSFINVVVIHASELLLRPAPTC